MSRDLQARLTTAHRNVHSLLNVLDRQLFSVQREDSPDYELMHEIVDYLSSNLGACHYPLEERLCADLTTRHPHLAVAVRKLGHQHNQLLSEGRALSAVVQLILDEHYVLRDGFLRLGRRYVKTYRGHLRIEERSLLPLLLCSAISTDEDEEDISEQAARDFEVIKDRLIAEGAGPWPWNKADHQHCAVCG